MKLHYCERKGAKGAMKATLKWDLKNGGAISMQSRILKGKVVPNLKSVQESNNGREFGVQTY